MTDGSKIAANSEHKKQKSIREQMLAICRQKEENKGWTFGGSREPCQIEVPESVKNKKL